MGEIAEDIVRGSCCELCGCYFQAEQEGQLHVHNYPVTCWDCWKTLTKKERKDRQRSLRPTL